MPPGGYAGILWPPHRCLGLRPHGPGRHPVPVRPEADIHVGSGLCLIFNPPSRLCMWERKGGGVVRWFCESLGLLDHPGECCFLRGTHGGGLLLVFLLQQHIYFLQREGGTSSAKVWCESLFLGCKSRSPTPSLSSNRKQKGGVGYIPPPPPRLGGGCSGGDRSDGGVGGGDGDGNPPEAP